MRVPLFVLASVLSVTLSTSSLAQPATIEVPLSVVARPNGDNLDIVLTNHGTKTASAWSIKFESQRPDGRPDVGSIGRDVYPLLVIPGKPGAGVGPIPAGQSAVVDSVPASAYPGAFWTPAAVVFEDGTSAGEEKRIAEIFKRRKADARSWKELSASLKQLARGQATPTSVRNAKDDIEANPQSEGQSKRKFVTDNLEILLKSPSTLDSGLKAFAAMAAKYAEGSAAHSVRR